MKKKIAILGSTGSIGTTTVNIIKKNLNDFEVIYLSANNKVMKIYQQAIDLKVKNIIIINKKKYLNLKKKIKNKKINIYNNFHNLKKYFINDNN